MALNVAMENLKKASGESWSDKFNSLSNDDKGDILNAHGNRFQISGNFAYDADGGIHEVTKNNGSYWFNDVQLIMINEEENIYAYITEDDLKKCVDPKKEEEADDSYVILAEALFGSKVDTVSHLTMLANTGLIKKLTSPISGRFFLHFFISYLTKEEQDLHKKLRSANYAEGEQKPTLTAIIREQLESITQKKKSIIHVLVDHLYQYITTKQLTKQFYNEIMFLCTNQDGKTAANLISTLYPSLIDDLNLPHHDPEQITHLTSINFSSKKSIDNLITSALEKCASIDIFRSNLRTSYLGLIYALNNFYSGPKEDKEEALVKFSTSKDAKEKLPELDLNLVMALDYLRRFLEIDIGGYGKYQFKSSAHKIKTKLELTVDELIGLVFSELKFSANLSSNEILLIMTNTLHEIMFGYSKYTDIEILKEEGSGTTHTISKCFMGTVNDLICALNGISAHVKILAITEDDVAKEVSNSIDRLHKDIAPSELFAFKVGQLIAKWVVTGKISAELLILLKQKDPEFNQYLKMILEDGGIQEQLIVPMINKVPGSMSKTIKDLVFDNIELIDKIPTYVYSKEKNGWIYSSELLLKRFLTEESKQKRFDLLVKIKLLKNHYFEDLPSYTKFLATKIAEDPGECSENKILLLLFIIEKLNDHTFAINFIEDAKIDLSISNAHLMLKSPIKMLDETIHVTEEASYFGSVLMAANIVLAKYILDKHPEELTKLYPISQGNILHFILKKRVNIDVFKLVIDSLERVGKLDFLHIYNIYEELPIFLLFESENIAALNYLIDKNVYDINQFFAYGGAMVTVLNYAIIRNKPELLKWVLSQPKLNLQNYLIPVNLVMALNSNLTRITEILLQDPRFALEVVDNDGDNAFMLALKLEKMVAAEACVNIMSVTDITYKLDEALLSITKQGRVHTKLLQIFLSKTLDSPSLGNPIVLDRLLGILQNPGNIQHPNEIIKLAFSEYLLKISDIKDRDIFDQAIARIIILCSKQTIPHILDALITLLSSHRITEYVAENFLLQALMPSKLEANVRQLQKSLLRDGKIALIDPNGNFLAKQISDGNCVFVKNALSNYSTCITHDSGKFIIAAFKSLNESMVWLVVEFATTFLTQTEWHDRKYNLLLLYFDISTTTHPPKLEVVQYLVQKEFDINQTKLNTTKTPLIFAIERHYPDSLVHYLVENGAQNTNCKSKASPLSLALLTLPRNNNLIKFLAETPGFLEQEFENQEGRKGKRDMKHSIISSILKTLREAGVSQECLEKAENLFQQKTEIPNSRKRPADTAEVDLDVDTPTNSVYGDLDKLAARVHEKLSTKRYI